MIARIATSVSAYAVRSTRFASGARGWGLRQQLDSGHPGHALVGDDQSHRIAAQSELSQDPQRVLARARGDDREVPCVTIAEIALDRAHDLLVVVDS